MKKVLFLSIFYLFIFWIFLISNESIKLTDFFGRTKASTTSPQSNYASFSTNVQPYILFDFLSGDDVTFGNLTPGIPIKAPSGGTITSVTTDAANGYTIGIADEVAGTNSSMVNDDSYIADYTGSFSSPTLWTGTGLGITLFSATQKDTKWGTGITFDDIHNKYAGIPENTTTAHTVTGFQALTNLSSWAWQIDVPNGQKTGEYIGSVIFTATAILS